jgi:integrase
MPCFEHLSSLLLVNSLPNGKIQTINSMKFHFKKIKDTLKINFKYHYLRHTYGTRLAEQNIPSHLLCNQMGHASGKVTEKYYIAVSKRGIEILTDNLNNL